MILNKYQNIRFINVLNIVLVVIGAVFLFRGTPTSLPTRSMTLAWDIGHIVLFSLFGIFLLRNINWLKEKSFFIKWLILTGTTLILGIVIELIQYDFNRTPDIADIWRNMIGIYLSLFFSDFGKMNKFLINLLRIVITIFFLVELAPLSITLIDEFNACTAFPVIADFESSLENERWHGNSIYEISDSISIHGVSSLKIKLKTAKYSGVSTDYFPSDWSNYTKLKFALFNKSPESLELVVRVHDKSHVNNFYDRFNRDIKAEQGWNEYAIDLKDIINAPRERKIIISEIKNIAIFAVKLPVPKIIYLDYIRLE